jgi:hypothetical protein
MTRRSLLRTPLEEDVEAVLEIGSSEFAEELMEAVVSDRTVRRGFNRLTR